LKYHLKGHPGECLEYCTLILLNAETR